MQTYIFISSLLIYDNCFYRILSVLYSHEFGYIKYELMWGGDFFYMLGGGVDFFSCVKL